MNPVSLSVPRERLRTICIAGSGQVGVIAALALKRALPDAQVIVIGLADDPTAYADTASTALPFTNKLHDRLGLSEDELIRRAGASHRLITRYAGWAGEGADAVGAVPYGAPADTQARARFAREWGGGSRGALAAPGSRLPATSLPQVLAEAGRFAVPPGDMPTPLDEVDYALRWNSPAYRDILIERAQQAGVIYLPGPIQGHEPDGKGGIAAIGVDGQGPIAADLFVDCSGPAARLISAMPGAQWEDWGDVLPVRRILHARPGQAMLALEDRFTLTRQGWLMEQAGRDGLHMALGLAPQMGEQDAVQVMTQTLGAQPARLVEVAPGCHRESWLGNVVALGDAAAWFEPLAHLNLDLAHRQLALLLEMLPGLAIEPLERAEFNRRAHLMAVQVRDTLATHYAAPRARSIFGEAPLPEGLDRVIDQYTRRGRLPHREEAALLAAEYMALLDALGLPGAVPVSARATASAESAAALRAFEEQAQRALAFAPPYAQFMQQMLAAGAAPAPV
ncbi:tryptophan 7-halogenase [Alteraurantiacibacter palmitatis]|uniref:Tryptophan 7-halogenase n=1 Tax=Alteraurantiacibacter palmitatis TaxID=2054628 RepID=A0ABV7E964_9SPHN